MVGTHCRNSDLWLMQVSRLASVTDHVLAAADYEARLKLVSGPGLRPSPGNFESFRDQRRISRLAMVDSKPADFEIEFQQCGNELLAFLLVAA